MGRYSFDVELFHLLLHAGLSRRTYGPTRTSTLDANINAVQQAVEHEAAEGPFDLLAAIALAIKATPPPATLIVISSGLSTSGGLDLRQVGWDASPSSVAAQLKAHGLLPDLAGYQVVFSGLGDTAGRQHALPLPQQTTLASYWLAICQESGAASCRVDDTDRPEPPSRSTIPVPLVPVPVVTSVTGPGNSTITSLPDTLLFPFDSSTLIPSADTILQPIAQRARSQDQLVSITGYASPDGELAPTTSPCQHDARMPSVTVSSHSAWPPARSPGSSAPAPPGRARPPVSSTAS